MLETWWHITHTSQKSFAKLSYNVCYCLKVNYVLTIHEARWERKPLKYRYWWDAVKCTCVSFVLPLFVCRNEKTRQLQEVCHTWDISCRVDISLAFKVKQLSKLTPFIISTLCLSIAEFTLFAPKRKNKDLNDVVRKNKWSIK